MGKAKCAGKWSENGFWVKTTMNQVKRTAKISMCRNILMLTTQNSLKSVTAICTILQVQQRKVTLEKSHTREKPYMRDLCAIEAVNSGIAGDFDVGLFISDDKSAIFSGDWRVQDF